MVTGGDPKAAEGSKIPMVAAGAEMPNEAKAALSRAAGTIYQVCFYEANGQYAGYSYSESQQFLANQCANWKQNHPGAYCRGYYYFYTQCPPN